jgi:uncharacterized YigZ family protein
MSGYFVPSGIYHTESQEKNSRFIATIGPAFSITDAKEFIAEIKDRYSDATHNVPVYVIGSGSSVTAHASDDGEPSGTAGKPALSVLMGSGLGDTALVITRYFGGTKLGTGGLVKAYSNAAKNAIQGVPKAKKIMAHKASIRCPYPIYERIRRLINQHQGFQIEESFTDEVSIMFSMPVEQTLKLQPKITDISNGTIEVIILENNRIALQPVKSSEENQTYA